MRAFDVLVFLLIFNFSLVIMGELGIFGEGVPAGEQIDVATEVGGVMLSGKALVTGIAFAIGAASVTVLGSRVVRPIGVVAIAFAGFYGYMLYQGMSILHELMIGTHHLVPSIVITLLTTLNVLFFAVAIIQLVSGGWKGFK